MVYMYDGDELRCRQELKRVETHQGTHADDNGQSDLIADDVQ